MAQILASVACHPDDEVLSAGALLLKARDAEFKIHLVWLTRGDGSKSPLASQRWSEAVNVGRRLNAEIHWIDLEDGKVEEAIAIKKVEDVLKKSGPMS